MDQGCLSATAKSFSVELPINLTLHDQGISDFGFRISDFQDNYFSLHLLFFHYVSFSLLIVNC